MFRDWIDVKGNLHPSQMRKTFRAALITGAEYILRVHGLARNPGLFPLSRMQVAELMGLDEAVVKRCIPIWKRAGLLRCMSGLLRRCHVPKELQDQIPKNHDRGYEAVHYCPHQYLLGEAYEAIFGLENGTRCALPPAENQSGQDKLTKVRESVLDVGAQPERDLSRWIHGVSVHFSEEPPEAEPQATLNLPALDDPRRQSDREPEFESAPWDMDEPQSLTEALKLLQTTIERLNAFPSTTTGRPSPAFKQAGAAVEKAKGWVDLFEALQMPFKPLSAEAMRSSMRLAPFRR
ncbi:hypothetical protein ADL19_31520 [Streptomyces purpurogeneiscleroticus]|nr:hypothetical protein ADL19_31520 [Streptomyces purpurogeneiscleroticus]